MEAYLIGVDPAIITITVLRQQPSHLREEGEVSHSFLKPSLQPTIVRTTASCTLSCESDGYREKEDNRTMCQQGREATNGISHQVNPGVDTDSWLRALHVMPPVLRDKEHISRTQGYL